MAWLPIDKGELYYEVTGREDGYPVLLFAPGFLSSRIERWRSNPAKPGVPQAWRDPAPVLEPHFRVISLDVRNAGQSWAEIGPDGSVEEHRATQAVHLLCYGKLAVSDPLRHGLGADPEPFGHLSGGE